MNLLRVLIYSTWGPFVRYCVYCKFVLQHCYIFTLVFAFCACHTAVYHFNEFQFISFFIHGSCFLHCV